MERRCPQSTSGRDCSDECHSCSASSKGFRCARVEWQDLDEFLSEHIVEALSKLESFSGAFGEEPERIWGKLILMEKGNRLAKIYLRNPTTIINGSSAQFDGKFVGFNHFRRVSTAENGIDLCAKIADGVVLKMCDNGNIKAMALGTAPVFSLNWSEDEEKECCDPVDAPLFYGKLPAKCPSRTDSCRVVRLFDARNFKYAIEDYMAGGGGSTAKDLFYKACLRVALVKKVASGWSKQPAWFLLINMEALELLRQKRPSLAHEFMASVSNGSFRASSKHVPSPIFTTPPLIQPIAHDRGGMELSLTKTLVETLERVTCLQSAMFTWMSDNFKQQAEYTRENPEPTNGPCGIAEINGGPTTHTRFKDYEAKQWSEHSTKQALLTPLEQHVLACNPNRGRGDEADSGCYLDNKSSSSASPSYDSPVADLSGGFDGGAVLTATAAQRRGYYYCSKNAGNAVVFGLESRSRRLARTTQPDGETRHQSISRY